MLLSIASIIANIIYCAVLNIEIYTDRAMLPDGIMREWKRSPVERLYISDMPWLWYLQLALAAVSVVTSILMLLGVKGDLVRKIRLISFIASTVMFVIIMIVTSNVHAKYA